MSRPPTPALDWRPLAGEKQAPQHPQVGFWRGRTTWDTPRWDRTYRPDRSAPELAALCRLPPAARSSRSPHRGPRPSEIPISSLSRNPMPLSTRRSISEREARPMVLTVLTNVRHSRPTPTRLRSSSAPAGRTTHRAAIPAIPMLHSEPHPPTNEAHPEARRPAYSHHIADTTVGSPTDSAEDPFRLLSRICG